MMPVIGLDRASTMATVATWETQGEDLTASAHALVGAEEIASGFTDRVRPVAAQYAEAWSGFTAALAARCQAQADGLRASASVLVDADDASRTGLGTVSAMLGAA